MCRLFGFRSSVQSGAHRSLVEAENSLLQQAQYHRDGWGIGYYIGRDAYIIKSEAGAHDCERFRLASSRLQSHAFVVHVRRATVGEKDYLNSHPFRFGRWIFAHNGTLEGFDKLKPWVLDNIAESHLPLIFGTTDSEHLFHYLLTAMGRNGIDRAGHDEVSAEHVGQVVREAIDTLFRQAKAHKVAPPILNFVLTNGDAFLAMRAGKDLFFATQKFKCADFEDCAEPRKVCMEPVRPDSWVNHLIVSSERIGDEDVWEELPQGAMVLMGKDFRVATLEPIQNFEICPPELMSPAIEAT